MTFKPLAIISAAALVCATALPLPAEAWTSGGGGSGGGPKCHTGGGGVTINKWINIYKPVNINNNVNISKNIEINKSIVINKGAIRTYRHRHFHSRPPRRAPRPPQAAATMKR